MFETEKLALFLSQSAFSNFALHGIKIKIQYFFLQEPIFRTYLEHICLDLTALFRLKKTEIKCICYSKRERLQTDTVIDRYLSSEHFGSLPFL